MARANERIARAMWFGLLRLMRTRFFRVAFRGILQARNDPKRRRANENWRRQNRFARRIGLPLLRTVVNLVLLSLAITVVKEGVLEAVSRGWLKVPDASGLPSE